MSDESYVTGIEFIQEIYCPEAMYGTPMELICKHSLQATKTTPVFEF